MTKQTIIILLIAFISFATIINVVVFANKKMLPNPKTKRLLKLTSALGLLVLASFIIFFLVL